MKKVVKILLPFLVASTAVFSGCKDKNKNKDDNRVLISFGDVHATESRVIDLAKLAEITNAKENFLFVVSTNTCGCWSEFAPVLNNYLTSEKVVCYRMDFANFKDAAATYGLANASSSTTTFAIFEDGKVKTFLNTANDSNIMYDVTKFKKYMEETIIKPSCYFITEDDINTIKTSGEKAVIYFERSGCGDCSALNPGLLREYVKNHSGMKKLYTFDCQDYWRADTAPDYQDYLDKKTELGLSVEGNPNFGYGEGVFPYFSLIENGQYTSGCVIYNDKVEEVDGKRVVTESYYTTERVQTLEYTNKVIAGYEVPASELNDRGRWTREGKDNQYKEILNSFLDWALPKQTYNF